MLVARFYDVSFSAVHLLVWLPCLLDKVPRPGGGLVVCHVQHHCICSHYVVNKEWIKDRLAKDQNRVPRKILNSLPFLSFFAVYRAAQQMVDDVTSMAFLWKVADKQTEATSGVCLHAHVSPVTQLLSWEYFNCCLRASKLLWHTGEGRGGGGNLVATHYHRHKQLPTLFFIFHRSQERHNICHCNNRRRVSVSIGNIGGIRGSAGRCCSGATGPCTLLFSVYWKQVTG